MSKIWLSQKRRSPARVCFNATAAFAVFAAGVVIVLPACRTIGDAPSPATVLFDGTDADQWTRLDGQPFSWRTDGDEMIVRPGGGALRTRETYTDFTLRLEFLVPPLPPEIVGQSRGNSGVYLQNRYEVQILDSWGVETSARDCGALYGRVAPRVNASRPPGEWQDYVIDFTAARFDASRRKTANARITVRHNGVLIHDDVELEGKTGAGAAEGPEPGAVVLQDHGSPVRFRNIRIVRKSDR